KRRRLWSWVVLSFFCNVVRLSYIKILSTLARRNDQTSRANKKQSLNRSLNFDFITLSNHIEKIENIKRIPSGRIKHIAAIGSQYDFLNACAYKPWHKPTIAKIIKFSLGRLSNKRSPEA